MRKGKKYQGKNQINSQMRLASREIDREKKCTSRGSNGSNLGVDLSRDIQNTQCSGQSRTHSRHTNGITEARSGLR